MPLGKKLLFRDDFLTMEKPAFMILTERQVMESRINLKSRTFAFALRVIKMAEYLRKHHRAYELASQVFRSGTAIGALVSEARYGESKRDFIHKMHIALKEANETIYWLQISLSAGYITKKMFDSINSDIEQILKMLVSTIKTAKSRL